jgi:trehalose 6-phosphate synthase
MAMRGRVGYFWDWFLEGEMINELTAAGDDVWTTERLGQWIRTTCSDEQVIVLANREPFRHDYDPHGRITVKHSAAGLVSAVEPLISTCSGVWVAHGAGTADQVTARDRDGLEVPPYKPAYRLRRVWLGEVEEQGYYYGFANEALWPLCHRAFAKPVFRSDDFTIYWTTNARFVDAVCEEATTESPLVFVHDYHFSLAPRLLRDRLSQAVIVNFWHIPWPHWTSFEICPWHQHLLEGLLGSSILGFQTLSDCRNFMDTVAHLLEAHVDYELNVITYQGRRVLVRAYPASVNWTELQSGEPSVEVCRDEVRHMLELPSTTRLGVGVDRLDYTKGIEEKFSAVEQMLECYPELRDTFVFVQLAQPSRSRLPAYSELRMRLVAAANRVNARFGRNGWVPIIVVEGDHPRSEVFRFLRAADVCYVSSLQDGMNLVSKEFVAAREDDLGVLVLSCFAGSARELDQALIVNPLDVDGTAHVLARALSMDEAEQQERMRAMRATVSRYNAHYWAARMLADAAALRDESAHREGLTRRPGQTVEALEAAQGLSPARQTVLSSQRVPSSIVATARGAA